MKKYILNIVYAVTAMALAGCDAKDNSLDYNKEVFDVATVSWSPNVSQEDKSVISDMLNSMSKVESCQFYMGVQGKRSDRVSFNSGFSSSADSVKKILKRTYNEDNSKIEESWVYDPYSDRVRFTDKISRSRYQYLSDGSYVIMHDSVFFTQVYKMPVTGLWVGPVTEMCVDYDYYIGKFEITQRQWQAVMGNVLPTGRYCKDESQSRNKAWYPIPGLGDDIAAYNIWYEDALLFCERLNQILGTGADGMEFRLPTEVEWECAARGGKYSRGFRYPGSDSYADVAWYYGNAEANLSTSSEDFGIHAGGKKLGNELDIYDMAGNVSEWMLNPYYRYSYRDSIASKLNVPALNVANHYVGDTLMLRGGSWTQSNAYRLASPARQMYVRKNTDVSDPDFQSAIAHCGFRIVYARKH